MNLPAITPALVSACSRCGSDVELTPYAASLGKRAVMCRACLRMPNKPKMTPQLYTEYLQTEHWCVKRGEALARAGHKCQVCSNKNRR